VLGTGWIEVVAAAAAFVRALLPSPQVFDLVIAAAREGIQSWRGHDCC
jgi:hypothetical protein